VNNQEKGERLIYSLLYGSTIALFFNIIVPEITMRKIVLVVLVSLVVLSLSGTSLQTSRSGGNAINVSFRLPAFHTEEVIENGISVQKLKVDATEDETWNENFSGLPQLERWVYLPEGYDAQVSMENPVTETVSNYVCSKTDDPADASGWLDISQPMSFRGNRIISFCVKPFQYDNNSQTLTTLNQGDIRIQFIPGHTSGNIERYQTIATTDMLKALCINRDDIRTVPPKQGSYLILYNGTSLQPILQSLADWKAEKGYEVHLVNTTTIGTTNSAIYDYIHTAYDTWENPPEFILICGRGTSGTYYVPTYVEYYNYNTVGDYRYTLLDNSNDLMPDAYIGRITFSSTDEIQTAVNRIISYEKMINLSTTNWLSKTFLLADTSNSGTSCLTTVSYVKSLIQDYDPLHLFTEAYTGTFPSQINSAINSGIGTYWYRGFGDYSGWTSNDINNLNNTGKYFFFSYITCFTGSFGTSQVSQAERLLRVGTPTLPKGAIGVVGASCETHTCLNNITTAGMASALYLDGMTQCGPAMVRGKLAMMANYPQNPANYVNQYMQQINLFGDPGLDIWLKQVSEITIASPVQLYAGGSNASFRVTLTDNTPVDGAWVCISDASGSLHISGYTDSNGWLILPYGATTATSAKITITKPNHRTFQTTVAVVNNPPLVTIQPITAFQQCYAGFTVEFPITVTNNGSTTMSNLAGNLTALSDCATVTQGSSGFGNVIAGNSAQSTVNFTINIGTDAPKGEPIFFNLHLSFDEGSFEIPFFAMENGANITLTSTVFSNNLLNHGTNTLNITLLNTTSVPLTGLQAHLESTHPLLTVQNPTQNLGNINPDATFSIPSPYNISVADSLPEGVVARLNLRLYNTSGFSQTISIDKQIGSPSLDDITGPDEYGYVCYGPGDAGYVPYNWIELEPTLGGNGTIINLSDVSTEGSGAYATINLPFQFRYYGNAYSQVTVCSNGFLMPGSEGSIEWMNWEIPGPMVPRPIIAPFWDDLLTDPSGRVLYQYNSTINAMIVQWQNLKNKYSPSLRETFQVVLYDPVVHSSPSGDSPILFQYKTFNNVDGGSYGVESIDHGQYASIGIADHTGLVGIGYSFNNQYPTTAQVLSNLTTLYFTTLPNYLIDSELIILSSNIEEISGNGNGLVDAGEQLTLSFIIKNIGLGAYSESQATLSTEDQYATIQQNQATLPSLLSNQIVSTDPPYVVTVSPSCPNQHTIEFILHIENGTHIFELPFEINVNAMQLECQNVEFIDVNNNFPEPGESGQLRFIITNLSNITAQNLSVLLNPPAGIIVNPTSQIVTIPAMSSLQLVFDVTISQDAEQGSLIDFNLNLEIPGAYENNIPMPVLIGVPDVFLDTGFEEADTNSFMQSAFSILVQPAQYINDEGNELWFMHSDPPLSYVFFYPLSTNDLIAARVSFTWCTQNPEATLSLMALLPNETNLITLWNSGPSPASPHRENIILEDLPTDVENIAFVLVANMAGESDIPIALDDLLIFTIHHAPGFISGNLSLDMFPELVTQVRVKVRYSNEVYYPDAAGNYLIPAYQGVNVVTAELESYASTVDSLAVPVVSGQTTSGHNFSLQRLCAPLNLQYDVQGNQLTLNWDLEGQQTRAKDSVSSKTDRYLEPDYYRIWIHWNNFSYQDVSDTQSYTRTVQPYGTYEIYVRSVYLFGGMVELYSNPSDTLEFTLTSGNDDIDTPVVFNLKQNQPNPFNPSTTIFYSLPERNDVNLTIYNLKGQVVKTLVAASMEKGSHSVIWNGLDNNGNITASGIYYYKLKWMGREMMRKMVLLK
jgi:hypothetical protein